MKFSISNIAWKPHESEEMYDLVKEYCFEGLEIAPSLFAGGSDKPYDMPPEVLTGKRREVEQKGLTLVSMQALLFGSEGLFLFEGKESRDTLGEYLGKAIYFAEALGIHNLVFGSPKNRIIPDSMSKDEAWQIALSFFKELGDYALTHHTCIGMEANAKEYGGNFITETKEAIELVKAVKSEGFKLNLDMGTMSLNGEDADIIREASPYINHIHVSEGFLAPVPQDEEAHHRRADAIRALDNYQGYVSIEMKADNNLDNKPHVRKALKFVQRVYGV